MQQLNDEQRVAFARDGVIKVAGAVPREAMNQIWPSFGDHVLSFEDLVEDFENHPDWYDVVGFDVEPGDALLFDHRIVHRSRGNTSDQRRVAISWRWLGDDARWEPVR